MDAVPFSGYIPGMNSAKVDLFNASEGLKGALLEDLREKGWFASPWLLPRSLAEKLRDQLREHQSEGRLTPAQIGQGEFKKQMPEIRGDSILWLSPQSEKAAEQELFAWLESFKNYLNQHLQLGLRSEELHYACYPVGSGYKKHVDCFQKNDDRVLSFVLYLNDSWESHWGGQIAIYNEKDSQILEAQIDPLFAQCVVFLSSSIFHEVIFTRHERISVTGWLKKTAPEADLPTFHV